MSKRKTLSISTDSSTDEDFIVPDDDIDDTSSDGESSSGAGKAKRPKIHAVGFNASVTPATTLSSNTTTTMLQQYPAYSAGRVGLGLVASLDSSSDGESSSGAGKAKRPKIDEIGFNASVTPATILSSNTTTMLQQYPAYSAGRGGLGLGASLDSSSDESTPAAKEYNSYSNTSMLMMKKMGYNADQGLGKSGQGRIDPIEASEQKGRRGLGLKLDGLDKAANEYDPSTETVQLREHAEWLHSGTDDLDELSRDELEQWLVLGDAKLTIDDETKFCDPKILADVLSSKSLFDNLGTEDMRRARTRSNPFETIRGAIFLNRAAVKMANMDSIFDFMFTNPVDEHGGPLVREDDLLYFADVCAGPGGFSEYVLWRKKWQAKGFGFTLRKENDFKLHDFFAGFAETFDPYYGVHDDGNVFDPENIESLGRYVLGQTQDKGVHFMMADGGFSVEGQENVQEILSKQLYLCQCIVALGIVREQGHFVVKLFDLFTPFSIGLIYLMYKCFQQICIFKPNTSRPANSERYLVCKWKKANTDTIYRHLFDVNRTMFTNRNATTEFLELVPHDVMHRDEKFFNYVCESNNIIGRNQIAGLLKIAAFCKDSTLKETRQVTFRSACLKNWLIPDQMRKAPVKMSTDQLFTTLMGKWKDEKHIMSATGKVLKADCGLPDVFPDLQHWYFVPVAEEESSKTYRTFFMSKGGRDVLQYSSSGTWTQIRDICLELSPNTLIYGEVTRELTGEHLSQTFLYALHIIDGIMLGGTDIRDMPLKKRLQMCDKFARALNKPSRAGTSRDGVPQASVAPISCRKLFALQDFGNFFDRLNHYKLKDNRIRYGLKLRNTNGPERFYVPRGLLFFNELKPNLRLHFSKKRLKHYYYDALENHSFYLDDLPNPNEIFGSFKSTFVNRKLWPWTQADQVSEDDSRSDPSLLYRNDIHRFISKTMSRQ